MTKSLYDYCIERAEFLLLDQMDQEKNQNLTAHDISYGSHRKIWWRCESGHHWEAAVYSRTMAGAGCPYCTGRKQQPFSRTLAAEYPDLIKEWHPTRNVGVTPEDLLPGTHRKVWWRCTKGHEWQAQVKSRVQGARCPVCSKRKVVAGENDLGTTHPEIAAQWNTKRNGTRIPQAVTGGNHAKVWWQCEKGHEWQATILSRTRTGSGCPVCAGKQVVPGQNDLASVFPMIAGQWHPGKNGKLTPEQVTPFSNQKAWWICERGHEYYSAIASRTQTASGCPYCAGRKVLAGFNDLATVEPRVAREWHPSLNGTLTPEMVTAGSHKKVWWQCPEGHVWHAMIFSRAGSQKSGCPVCAGRRKPGREAHYRAILPETHLL